MTDATQPSLVCTLRAITGEQSIDVSRELVAGRDASCDIVLVGGQTSRKHAKLSPQADGVWIEDLQSTNGTFVNEQRITSGTLAKHGDVVRFDTVAFNVVAPNAAPVENGATVFRAIESAATILKAPPVAPATPPAPPVKPVAKEQVVAAKSGITPPPSWALDAQQSVDGTRFLSGTQLQQIGGQPSNAAAAVVADITAPTLLGASDPIRGIKFQLSSSGALNQWEVGRAEDANIRIDHPSISKNHAQIINEGARWKLIDLMSANGTFVNGTKGLTTYLKSGDVVRFGQIECHFLLGGKSIDPRQKKPVAPMTAQKNGKMSRTQLAVVSFVITALIVTAALWFLRQH